MKCSSVQGILIFAKYPPSRRNRNFPLHNSVRHVDRLQINLMPVISPLSGNFLKFHQNPLLPHGLFPHLPHFSNICCSGELAAPRYFSSDEETLFASERNTFECKFAQTPLHVHEFYPARPSCHRTSNLPFAVFGHGGKQILY